MQSAAFVVGPLDGAGEALAQLCKDTGFQSVHHYTSPSEVLTQMRRTPVCFFLVSSSVPKSEISDFVTEIRLHQDAQLKFQPLLYLSEDPSPRTINFCLQSGFDDIVAPPFTTPRLLDRLKAQLTGTKIYCRTDNYFGPDRRRLADKGSRPDWLQTRPEVCDILEVRRDLRTGIHVSKRRAPAIIKHRLDDTPTAAVNPAAQPADDMLLID